MNWFEDAQAARQALMDYYGTAVNSGMPAAMIDLARVELLSDEDVIEEAYSLGLIG